MGRKKTIGQLIIAKSMQGKRVLDILQQELSLSNRQIRKVIRTKGLFINGRLVHSNYNVKTGEELRVKLPIKEQIKIEIYPMELSIIYEDPWLLGINKPAGINVHNTRPQETPALVSGVAYYLHNKKECITPRPIHRLDKDTSGIVLFAKSANIQSKLSADWNSQLVTKEYWALVEGTIYKQGIIDLPVKNKPALTKYYPKKQYNGFTEVNIKLMTGRTHQIRKHFKAIGHPVLGDKIYNAHSCFSLPRLALHAIKLKFTHPVTNKEMQLQTESPRENLIINSLRQFSTSL